MFRLLCPVLLIGLIALGSILVTKNLPRRWAWLSLIGVLVFGFGRFAAFVAWARNASAVSACINDARQIDSAIQQYALEQSVPAGAPVPSAAVIGQYIHGGMPVCQHGKLPYQISGTVDAPVVINPNQACPYSDWFKKEAAETVAISACINNQRQIASAIRQWAQEESTPASTLVPSKDIIDRYIKGGMPVCPRGGWHYQVSGSVDDPKIVCPIARDNPPGYDPLHP